MSAACGITSPLEAWNPGRCAAARLLHGFMDCGVTVRSPSPTPTAPSTEPDRTGLARFWPLRLEPQGYWFPDYFWISTHRSSGRARNAAGRSPCGFGTGGNVAMIYMRTQA
ncbi:MAG: hypothetical protein IPF50_18685 [Proteobacteria bacterium]|nr:hypothetical protein [Pseudomonadota bacterium]